MIGMTYAPVPSESVALNARLIAIELLNPDQPEGGLS